MPLRFGIACQPVGSAIQVVQHPDEAAGGGIVQVPVAVAGGQQKVGVVGIEGLPAGIVVAPCGCLGVLGIVGHAHDAAAMDGVYRAAQEGRPGVVGQGTAFGAGRQGRHGGQFCSAECCRIEAGLVRGFAGRGRRRRAACRVGRIGGIGCAGRIAGNVRGAWSEGVGGRWGRSCMRFMAGRGLSTAGDKAQAQQAGHGQVGGARNTRPPGCAKGHVRRSVQGGAQRGAGVGGDGGGRPVGVLHRTVSAGKAGPMVVPLAGCGSAESRREAVFALKKAGNESGRRSGLPVLGGGTALRSSPVAQIM